jgi:hypothetical protein
MRQIFPPSESDMWDAKDKEAQKVLDEDKVRRIKQTILRYLPKKYSHLVDFIYDSSLVVYRQYEGQYHGVGFTELLELQIDLLKELDNAK